MAAVRAVSAVGGQGDRRPARPRGREAVRLALLEAAIELFAERGPASVSLREVAAAADVNLGLIPRYIGSKDDLLREVMDSLAGRLARRLRDGSWPSGGHVMELYDDAVTSPYWRILAFVVLSGRDVHSVQTDFPAVRSLVAVFEQAREAGLLDPSLDPRQVVAAGVAQVLGWLVFEDFLRSATGLDADPLALTALRDLFIEQLRRIQTAPAAVDRKPARARSAPPRGGAS